MKRITDFLLAACCLIIFSPIILLCYLIIKIGGGPAIYKQERIGLHGQPFYIYKFRSMVIDAEKEGEELLQQENDPRLTKIGRFLRAHHLDELPQLWNVLVGDMSFVGYRPERQYYIDQIMLHNPRYPELYQIRPGITSYATLYNGYTDTMEKMLKRLEMDLYYLEHRSLWMDFTILFKTFVSIVSGRVFLLLPCLLASMSVSAQDSLQTSITYDLSSEIAVGTGDFTAYQLVSNRHHVLSTRPNTGYVRGAVEVAHPLSKYFTLTGGADVIASVHADHKAYLQQFYASLEYDKFFFEIGARENDAILRNAQLSSGAFAKGTNAKPIPQVRIGTRNFWTVPYTKGWLQIHFEGGYGKLLDSRYREDIFNNHTDVNYCYSTGAWYHQKHLYFRTNPEKRFFVTAGIEHVAQFGGKSYERVPNGSMLAKEKSVGLKDFIDIILPVGDANYYENEAMEDWVFGNHLGSMTIQLGWNINRDHQVQVYLDDPFEDGSGMRKGNGWDGLWGVEYTNRAAGRQWVRGAVVEYFQTTNQSGPLHYDRGDYPEPIRSQITDLVVGKDEYYNHSYYVSYSHYGMTLGNPLITSPIYNMDGFNMYRDNRVKAWHVAVNGELTDNISYLVKGSYREGMGTYDVPIYPKRHTFNAMLQGIYAKGPWQVSAAYAFDKGNVYGDNSTFNFKIGYHGKIL